MEFFSQLRFFQLYWDRQLIDGKGNQSAHRKPPMFDNRTYKLSNTRICPDWD